MTRTRNLFRWTLLIAGIVLACLQLNGATYAAWASSGPPTSNPDGWMFVAGNRLAWTIASFLAGLGIFFLFSPNRRTRKLALATFSVAVLITTFPYTRELMASDACLDAGGKWSDLRCIH